MLTHNLTAVPPTFERSVEQWGIWLKVRVTVAEEIQIFDDRSSKAEIRPFFVEWDKEPVLSHYLLFALLKSHVYPFVCLLQAPKGEAAQLNAPNTPVVVDRYDGLLHRPFVRKVLFSRGQLQSPLNLVLA